MRIPCKIHKFYFANWIMEGIGINFNFYIHRNKKVHVQKNQRMLLFLSLYHITSHTIIVFLFLFHPFAENKQWNWKGE